MDMKRTILSEMKILVIKLLHFIQDDTIQSLNVMPDNNTN